jgi:hypothetical protein
MFVLYIYIYNTIKIKEMVFVSLMKLDTFMLVGMVATCMCSTCNERLKTVWPLYLPHIYAQALIKINITSIIYI